MRGPPERVSEDAVRAAVRAGWFEIGELDYVPEGGGAYHWQARGADGRAWFVTGDDLAIKPWLGSDHDAVFAGLSAAYATAMELRAAGLSFVVAPIAGRHGEPAVRVDDRHSVSVFERVDGRPGRWGDPLDAAAAETLVAMLGALHASAPPPSSAAGAIAQRGLDVPRRTELDAALDAVSSPWDGGPLSELARQALADHVDDIQRSLASLDRAAAELADDRAATAITHGEPHPGNLIHTDAGIALVDWDTVAVARPERDLWMLADVRPQVVERYEELTGIAIDRDALVAHRLLWAMADVAAFTVLLRGEHHRAIDTERSLVGLRRILAGAEPRPYAR